MVTKRVFLAIAHNAFREAVAEVLNGEPDFEVVAQAGSLSEVGDVELEHHKLDIALVDPSLPEGERLVIVREVSKRDGAKPSYWCRSAATLRYRWSSRLWRRVQ